VIPEGVSISWFGSIPSQKMSERNQGTSKESAQITLPRLDRFFGPAYPIERGAQFPGLRPRIGFAVGIDLGARAKGGPPRKVDIRVPQTGACLRARGNPIYLEV
jgi:hypothetical protein